jgi:hypothetical protein
VVDISAATDANSVAVAARAILVALTGITASNEGTDGEIVLERGFNVLVGFDETFRPPVALGELMQQKMAAISGLDVSEEEKRRQAIQWFTEHGVPEEERVAWLDAF